MGLKTETYQPAGFLRERVLSTPRTIAAAAVDASNTGITYKLLPGLVLGVITASGKLAQYNDAASDGTQTAKYVLLEGVDMKGGDPAASAFDHVADVLELGTVLYSGLHGSDANGKADLISAGIRCLDA